MRWCLGIARSTRLIASNRTPVSYFPLFTDFYCYSRDLIRLRQIYFMSYYYFFIIFCDTVLFWRFTHTRNLFLKENIFAKLAFELYQPQSICGLYHFNQKTLKTMVFGKNEITERQGKNQRKTGKMKERTEIQRKIGKNERKQPKFIDGPFSCQSQKQERTCVSVGGFD